MSGHTWFSSEPKCVLNWKTETLSQLVLCDVAISDTGTNQRLKVIYACNCFAGFEHSRLSGVKLQNV